MAVDDKRDAFEATYRPLLERGEKQFPEFKDGKYLGFLQLQWDGWQARGEHDAATKPEAPNIQAAASLIKKTAYILTDNAAGRGSFPYLRNPEEIARAVAELWGMGGENETPRSNGIPREIPVLKEEMMATILADLCANGWEYGTHPVKKAKVILDAIRPYLRTTEPVSASLGEIACKVQKHTQEVGDDSPVDYGDAEGWHG